MWAGQAGFFAAFGLWGGSARAANGPECGGLGLVMGDFGRRYVNFFKK